MFRRPLLALLGLIAAGCTQAQSHLGDVVYGHKMGMALTMEIFKPAHPNHIAVVWMVSGGWVSDYHNVNPDLAKIFTDRGMTVFEVLHGSQPKFQLTEILSDVNRAIRFIRTNAGTYDVDPNKIGVSGGSAGGHLSLMLGAFGTDGNPSSPDPIEHASSKVNAIACFYPPTDFLNWGKTGQAAMDIPMLRVFSGAFGINDKTPHDTLVDMSKTFSPIYGVTAKFPPTLIYHGDADMLVPLQQSQIFIDKLKSLGVPCKLVVRKGQGHGYRDGMVEDLGACADWFQQHLGK